MIGSSKLSMLSFEAPSRSPDHLLRKLMSTLKCHYSAMLVFQDSVFHEKPGQIYPTSHAKKHHLSPYHNTKSRDNIFITTLPSKDLMCNCPQTDSTTISQVPRLKINMSVTCLSTSIQLDLTCAICVKDTIMYTC